MPEPQTAQPYTVNGRRWIADDPAHAIQQHTDASPDEGIEGQPVLAAVAQRDYVVTVHHTTGAEAAQVMAERLGHDEDCGFPYAIEYVNADALPVSITVGDDAAVLPVDVFRADGNALVVQLETDATPGRIRLNLNDSAVYDGDPEHDEPAVLITLSQLRQWAGVPVTEELVEAMRRVIEHSSIPDALGLIAEGVRERLAATGR